MTLTQYYNLIYRPYPDFTNCPKHVLLVKKRKKKEKSQIGHCTLLFPLKFCLTGNLISFCVSWLKTFSIECKCYHRMFLNLGLCDGSPWVNSGYLRILQNDAVSFSVPYARRHAVTICSVSGDVNFDHFARQCLPGFSHETYCLSYKQYLQRGIIYTSFAPQTSPTRFSAYWRLLPKSTIIMCLLNSDFLGPSLTPHSLADVLL